MLEQDYLKDSTTYSFKDERSKALNEYSSQLIRELIIPKLTKEVNSSKRYAPLRQVYYSLILAQWFKQKFKQGLSPQGTVPVLIDSQNLSNLASREGWSKTTYFNAYKKSFAEGEYNIKEPVYTPTGQVIRSYFSGGIKIGGMSPEVFNIAASPAGNKPYLLPIHVDNNGIVTQPLAGSPVLSQQEVEKLKKKLAFYLMANHDLSNLSHRLLDRVRKNIRKGAYDEQALQRKNFFDLFKIINEYLEEAELSIDEPVKFMGLLQKLKISYENLRLEFLRLRTFLGQSEQEEIDLIVDILNLESEVAPLTITEVLKWSIDKYKNSYVGCLNIEAELSDSGLLVTGNKYLIKRMIGNLLSNSERAFIDKGVAFKNRLVGISCYVKNNNFIIIYKDNAGGIPLDILPVLFEPRITTKDREEYGMAICKDIIAKMGGTISVQNELGKGTTFTITLPAASSSPAVAKTLLYVDDDSTLLAVRADYLRLKGYKVITARNGQEALEKMEVRHIDLIITDIMMPIMDGLEFVRRLGERQVDGQKIPPIIVCASFINRQEFSTIKSLNLDYLLVNAPMKKLIDLINKKIPKASASSPAAAGPARPVS